MKRQPTEGEQRVRGEYLRWESHQLGACPVCGAELRLLTPDEYGWKPVAVTPEDFRPGNRYGVLHSWFDHKMAGVAPVGLAR